MASVLSVAPAALVFAGTKGAANPASQSLAVTNSGAATVLPFTVASDSAWLTSSAASGNTPQTVSISVDLSGLAAGTYGGAITIASAGIAGSPSVIPVSLIVTLADTFFSLQKLVLSVKANKMPERGKGNR